MKKIPEWVYVSVSSFIVAFMVLWVDSRADAKVKPIKEIQALNVTKIAVLESRFTAVEANTKSNNTMLQAITLKMQLPLPKEKL